MNFPLISRPVLPLLVAVLALAGSRGAAAENVTIPTDTVVWVTLDEPITSETAQLGQQVTGTVSPMDRSGFPLRTQFIGVVTEVSRPTATMPGMLDVDWVAVRLPDERATQNLEPQSGARLAAFGVARRRYYRGFDGELWPVNRPYAYRDGGGRFVRDRDRWRDRDWRDDDDDDSFDPRWIGYGAGAGALIGGLTGGSFLEGALFGGLGGAAYEAIAGSDLFGSAQPATGVKLAAFQARRQDWYHDARVNRGDAFGIAMRRPFVFDRRDTHRFASLEDARRAERVLGMREELFNTSSVMVNGRRVEFDRQRPVFLNGTLYYPLENVEDLVNLKTEYPLGRNAGSPFRVLSRGREIQIVPNRRDIRVGGRTYDLRDPVVTMNNQVYVPAGFISRFGGFREHWNPERGELRIDAIR